MSRFEVDESGRGGRRSPPLADNFVAATKRLKVKVKEKRGRREREREKEGINRGVSSEEGGEGGRSARRGGLRCRRRGLSEFNNTGRYK